MRRLARDGGAPAVLVLAALAHAGCDQPERPVEGLLVVGAVLPLTGASGRTGEEILTGLELGCESDGSRTILRVVDGGGAPALSAECFRSLAKDPEVSAVVGGWFATTARTLSALCGTTDLPFVALSPLAGAMEVVPGAFALHRLPALAQAAALFAASELGAERAGLVRVQGSDASTRLASAFESTFPGQVAWTASPDENGRLALPRGPEPAVDVIYVAGPAEWALEASRLSAKTRRAAVMTADGWADDGLSELVEAGVPVYIVSFYSPTDPSPANRRLLEACAGLGREPTAAIALGWDAARLIRTAVGAGGEGRAALQAALQGRASLEGATGRIEFPLGAPPRETPAVSSLTRGGVVFLRRVEAAPAGGA